MKRIKSRTRVANKISEYVSAFICMFVVAFLVSMIHITRNPEHVVTYLLDLLPSEQSGSSFDKPLGPLSDSLTNSAKNIEMSKLFVELSRKEQ